MAFLKHTTMASAVDPRKVKALLRESDANIPETPDDEDGGGAEQGAADEDEPEAGEQEGDEGDEELTVEQLTKKLKGAVPQINEIIDEFRAGEGNPNAGVEALEEVKELGAEFVHSFCDWIDEAGKKDFRALGEALDVEDVDGFVGWCRAVNRMMEEGGDYEGDGDGEGEDAADDKEDAGDDGEGGGDEEDEDADEEDQE